MTPQKRSTHRPRLVSFAAVSWLVASVTLAADPLHGSWVLNRARTHYGNGAEERRRETFDCEFRQPRVTCVLRSVRQDGRSLEGRFSAVYDGKPHPVSGLPDVDTVTLSKIDDFVADATFASGGRPVFGYRAVKSADQRSLTIMSVEPVSRRILTSVIVYDRR
jgi:hypothetical protein